MELGAMGVLDAVWWPWASLGFEGYVIRRVPISRGEDSCMCLLEDFYVVIKRGNYLVAFGNRQRAAWTEIVLHVHNYKRVSIAYAKVFFQQGHLNNLAELLGTLVKYGWSEG